MILKKYKTDISPIAGKGIFAKKDIPKDNTIGLAIIKKRNTGIPNKDYKRKKLGKYVNHSPKPNLKLKKKINKIYYISKKKIKKGEELTINYNNFDFEGKRNFK